MNNRFVQYRASILGFFGMIFLAFFGAWEVLNYYTTEAGAAMMFGLPPSDPGWWVRLIAIAMVGLDIFHLVLFFMDRLIPGLIPEDANLYTWLAWGIVTLGDIVFSIYTFSYNFESGVAAGTTRGPQLFSNFLQYAPFVLSFMTWGMTLFTIQIGRSFIAQAFGVGVLRSLAPAPRNPGGGGGGPQPRNQGPQPQQGKGKQPTFRPVARPMPIPGKNTR